MLQRECVRERKKTKTRNIAMHATQRNTTQRRTSQPHQAHCTARSTRRSSSASAVGTQPPGARGRTARRSDTPTPPAAPRACTSRPGWASARTRAGRRLRRRSCSRSILGLYFCACVCEHSERCTRLVVNGFLGVVSCVVLGR